jgi:hypothetical protein
MQKCVGRGMHVQSRSHQEEQWFVGTQLAARKVSELMELAAGVVPGNARPLIQAL